MYDFTLIAFWLIVCRWFAGEDKDDEEMGDGVGWMELRVVGPIRFLYLLINYMRDKKSKRN